MISPEPTDRPALTITEAARACRVDRRTIRRRLDAGELPGAYREDGPHGPGAGAWRIPIADLLAAGLRPNAAAASGPLLPPPPPEADALELVELRQRVAVAEARLAERDRLIAATEARAETAELALRALTAGPVPASTAPASTAATGPYRPPTSLWRRLTGRP